MEKRTAALNATILFLFVLAVLVEAIRLNVFGLSIVGAYILLVLWEFRRKSATSFFGSAELLGLSLPLVGFIGSETLTILALVFLVREGAILNNSIAWARELFFVIVCWSVFGILVTLDPQTIKFLWQGADGPGDGGLYNLLLWVRLSTPPFIVAIDTFVKWVILFILVSHFARVKESRERIIDGLAIGLGLAATFTALQLAGLAKPLFTRQNPFWTELKRLTGTFTDPNAFGVLVALVVPLLVARVGQTFGIRRLLYLGLIIIWIFLGSYSGSRSFVVGLGVYFIYLVYQRSQWAFWGFGLFSVLAVAIFAYQSSLNPDWSQGIVQTMPESLKRIWETLSVDTARTAFFSRTVFAQIAGLIFLHNPILGIGLNRFPETVPVYSALLGYDLNLWRDNTNNFYLGLLAEMGLVGLVVFVLAIARLSRQSKKECLKGSKGGVVVLAVLLFFGPHLEFIEVTIVAALLLGGALKPELPKKLPWSAWIIAPCLGVVMFLSAYFSENGFFSWEKDGQDVYRWIGRRASGKIQCAENGIATMWLQAASPDVIYKDVIVKLETTVKPPKEIRLTDPLVKEIKISCSSGEPHLRLPPLFPQREMVRYRLTISRIWTPRKYIAGSLDSRPLGVRVFVGGVKEVIPAT